MVSRFSTFSNDSILKNDFGFNFCSYERLAKVQIYSQIPIAVHGEGRVKVLELQKKETSNFKFCIVQSLPHFFHWRRKAASDGLVEIPFL